LCIAVEPPVRQHPKNIAIDSNGRSGLFDYESAGEPAPELLQAVGMRVIPEGPGIGWSEFVGEALAGCDGPSSKAGHAIHGIREPYAVPMDGGLLTELVFDRQPDGFTLANPKGRAWNFSVIGPHAGHRITCLGEGCACGACDDPIFGYWGVVP